METVHIIVLSSLAAVIVAAFWFFRPRTKQITTWDPLANDGRGGKVPLLDKDGVIIEKKILKNFELYTLIFAVLLTANYYALVVIRSPIETLTNSVKYGIYHIAFGLILPAVMVVAAVIGYYVGLSPGRVVKVEKVAPYHTIEETKEDKKSKKLIKTGKVRYEMNLDEPGSGDIETEMLSIFKDADGVICEAAGSIRKAINQDFVKWRINEDHFTRGRTKVFKDVYETETVISAHAERYEDKLVDGQVWRRFLTWDTEPRVVKQSMFLPAKEYEKMTNIVILERIRQAEFLILQLRNNEQVVLAEREDYAQERSAKVIMQTLMALSDDLELIDSKKIDEDEVQAITDRLHDEETLSS